MSLVDLDIRRVGTLMPSQTDVLRCLARGFKLSEINTKLFGGARTAPEMMEVVKEVYKALGLDSVPPDQRRRRAVQMYEEHGNTPNGGRPRSFIPSVSPPTPAPLVPVARVVNPGTYPVRVETPQVVPHVPTTENKTIVISGKLDRPPRTAQPRLQSDEEMLRAEYTNIVANIGVYVGRMKNLSPRLTEVVQCLADGTDISTTLKLNPQSVPPYIVNIADRLNLSIRSGRMRQFLIAQIRKRMIDPAHVFPEIPESLLTQPKRAGYIRVSKRANDSRQAVSHTIPHVAVNLEDYPGIVDRLRRSTDRIKNITRCLTEGLNIAQEMRIEGASVPSYISNAYAALGLPNTLNTIHRRAIAKAAYLKMVEEDQALPLSQPMRNADVGGEELTAASPDIVAAEVAVLDDASRTHETAAGDVVRDESSLPTPDEPSLTEVVAEVPPPEVTTPLEPVSLREPLVSEPVQEQVGAALVPLARKTSGQIGNEAPCVPFPLLDPDTIEDVRIVVGLEWDTSQVKIKFLLGQGFRVEQAVIHHPTLDPRDSIASAVLVKRISN